MNRLNDQQKESLERLYWQENKTLPEIAKLFGVTYPCIHRWLIRLGIPRRTNSEAQRLSHHTDKIDRQTLVNLYQEGKLQKEIGKILGLSQTAISLMMKRYGIPTNGKAHFGAINGMYGRTHTPEAREKIRKANQKQFSDPLARERHALLTCKQIQDGKTGKAYNKLEQIVAALLDKSGIVYEQQYRIGRFLFDFFLPNLNTLIEVHGTFWHADPRRYSGKPLSKIQQRNVANDARKADRAAKDGYRLVIIWEYDVYHSSNPLANL